MEPTEHRHHRGRSSWTIIKRQGVVRATGAGYAIGRGDIFDIEVCKRYGYRSLKIQNKDKMSTTDTGSIGRLKFTCGDGLVKVYTQDKDFG